MAIEFRCPNGHRLSCPDDRAGRNGKCPKCGAAFTVPAAGTSTAATSDSGVTESDVAETSAEASVEKLTEDSGALSQGINEQIESPSRIGLPVPDDLIIFLCPNGHKLNCPINMQGRAGKCPHCGAKFVIPMADEPDTDDEPAAAQDDFLGLLAEGAEAQNGYHAGGPQYGYDVNELTVADEAPPAAAAPSAGANVMARLFPRLWKQRGEQGVIELYLKGGEVVSPDWYAPRLSNDLFGMFGLQDADGSYTMTVVNWDAIERIAVRGMEELPEGMFVAD